MRLLLAILIVAAASATASADCDPAPCPAGPAATTFPDAGIVEPPQPPSPMPAPPMPSDVPIYSPDVIRVGPVDDNFGNRIETQDPAHK